MDLDGRYNFQAALTDAGNFLRSIIHKGHRETLLFSHLLNGYSAISEETLLPESSPCINFYELLRNLSHIDHTECITGICHVYNGNSIRGTFKPGWSLRPPNPKVDVLEDNLDGRSERVMPEMMWGTGEQLRKTFWLDIGER